MERVLHHATTNTDLGPFAIAVAAIVMSCWLIQKKLMEIGTDVLSEIEQNSGTILPELFNLYKEQLFSHMFSFRLTLGQAYNVLETLFNQIIAQHIGTRLVYPHMQDLKTIFSQLTLSYNNTLNQTELFYRTFANIRNPVYIRNYERYVQTIEEFNIQKQAMIIEAQNSMDRIDSLLQVIEVI